MSAERFDELCKSLATGASRRQVLKAIGVAIAGGVASAIAGREPPVTSAQACRPIRHPCEGGQCCQAGLECVQGAFEGQSQRCCPPGSVGCGQDCCNLSTSVCCGSGNQAQCIQGGCCTNADCGTCETCTNNQCVPITCPTGTECVNGQCVCTATSCPNGCCNASGCQTSSNATCGTGGATCVACPTGTECVNGQCVCNATSCPNGCCDASGVCRTSSNATCGTGGVPCVNCTSTNQNCVNGVCTTPCPKNRPVFCPSSKGRGFKCCPADEVCSEHADGTVDCRKE